MHNGTDQHGSIEQMAYEFYVLRGKLDGYDLSDWFQAEKVINKKMSLDVGRGALGTASAVKSDKKRKKQSER